ncbi:helix-turn-helix domain-containing protein [Kitasatospora sp. NPDC048239]|uniref:helix-turn-helix domain-containing protein n=1 Tax=Kitasatospora sp. NPDC048239 TaxID=3364046 RepID=UPI00371DDAAB
MAQFWGMARQPPVLVGEWKRLTAGAHGLTLRKQTIAFRSQSSGLRVTVTADSRCSDARHMRGQDVSHRKADAGPTSSPAVMFGEALRFARERAGYTQAELGKLVHCDRTVVTRAEGGQRPMQAETVESCDELLQMGGLLIRLFERVDWHADIEHPDWFQKYVDLEAEAVAVRAFQYNRVNGLLQCEDYAHALFSLGDACDSPALVKERVVARLSRQERYLQSGGPLLLVVLHEGIIRSVVGGPGVMRRQMEHLLSVGELSNISIQVAPFDRSSTRLPATSMFLLVMPDGKEWIYSESLYRGHFSDAPTIIAEHRCDFDLMRGAVLSVSDSRVLIAEAMEEYEYAERRAQLGGLAEEQPQRRQRRQLYRGGPRLPRPRPRA